MARKRKSKPTSKQRSGKQRVKDRYAHAREDAQLAGLIPTTPEEALKSERVDPALQGEQQLPGLVRQALREDWSVPDAAKPRIVGALLEPFFGGDVVLDKDGNQIVVAPDRNLLKENAKVLGTLDQRQWERDHPVEAGKAKGAINVSQTVAVAVNPLELYKRALEEVEVDEVDEAVRAAEALPPAVPPVAPDANGQHLNGDA